jgi:hypothetical protein
MKNIKTKEGVDLAFINIKDIPIKVNVPNSSNEITHPVNLGKLSEITEEQAVELVEKIGDGYKMYNGIGSTGSAVKALHSAALSLQIPEAEFSKYLVIKL